MKATSEHMRRRVRQQAGKVVRSLFPEGTPPKRLRPSREGGRPEGCFAEKAPDPFSSGASAGCGGQSAFTLVEVLVTLTLVAIILPVAMRGISLAIVAAGHARRQIEAASLAEAKLAELLVTDAWQGPELSGDFGPERPAFRWTAEVAEWEGTTVQQVAVRVTWLAQGRERHVALTTLVYSGNQ